MGMKMPGTIIIENGPQGRNVYVRTPLSRELVSDRFRIGDELNNKKCTVEMEDGKVMLIECGRERLVPADANSAGKVEVVYSRAGSSGSGIRPPQGNHPQPQKKKHQPGVPGQQGGGRTARAPYNFVPLNKKVVASEHGDNIPPFDNYHPNLLSGYIELDIEALTPLYIRGTNKDGDEETPSTDFFGPGGITKIPGSSLRGMVRNLVEIVTWSKFKFFEDKVLYYRGLADPTSLGEEYQKNMSSYYDKKKKSPQYKFNAGYLFRSGRDYFIIPAKKENGKEFSQVKKRNMQEEFVVEKQGDGKYLVISGKMPKKERDWLINAPDMAGQRIKVPKKDVEAYKLDSTRYCDENPDESKRKDGDLLRMLKHSKDGIVPCFYVRWKDSKGEDRVSFGHTGYFRLAYNLTIGDHVNIQLKDDKITDMAEAIFGRAENFASRVYFDDAVICDEKALEMNEISIYKLYQPKPTTFQHYLEQPGDKTPKSLKHWNSPGISIRGHKLYWHRNINNKPDVWKKADPKSDNDHEDIRPVRQGARFIGRIRFENLTKVELGALLFVLNLPEGHCHKIGMGKPFGLGSIKIVPKLNLIKRAERYRSLFADNTWNTAEKTGIAEDYIGEFTRYIAGQLKGSQENINASEPWANERMKCLKALLCWDGTDSDKWIEETRYMSIDDREYRYRPVLPTPLEVERRGRENKIR
ncbi:TIGR03986 family type III CRISPR-associated RAMP protein [Thermincola ferriacetica]